MPHLTIALASPRVATALDDGLGKVVRLVADASARGASVVCFPEAYLPGLRGQDFDVLPWGKGEQRTTFGSSETPYYEKAMLMRSIENTIYFASVNYAVPFQESATAVIGPQGVCEAWLPYGREGVLLHTIDLDAASGLLAKRFAPERYD